MPDDSRPNLARLWSLLGLIPFLVVFIYPPWLRSYRAGVRRAFLWDDSSLNTGIAVGQWALELGATLVLAGIIIGITFGVTSKGKSSDAS